MTFKISRVKTLAVGTLALLSVVATSASALTYVEGADLAAGGTPLGALSAGTNTVSGTVSSVLFGFNGANDVAVADNVDRFTATLAAGQVITSVSLSVSGFPGNVLILPDLGIAGNGFSPADWSGSITGQSPFGDFIYDNGVAAGGFTGNAGGPATLDVSIRFLADVVDLVARDFNLITYGFDYVVTIHVRQLAVPEPGALALLGAALAGLALARRRRG